MRLNVNWLYLGDCRIIQSFFYHFKLFQKKDLTNVHKYECT